MRISISTNIFLLAVLFHLTACNNSTVNDTEEIAQSDTVELNESNETIIMPSAVEFPSLDGLLISGVLWEIDTKAPILLLCHQAGSNYHEYDEIAPQLNELGFNCLAIDQRAGGVLFDLVNQTADRAISENKTVSYVDAEQDLLASINYCPNRYHTPVILWGSSYSAGLSLHLAESNENVEAVIAFSPGDYFEEQRPLLAERMKSFTKPFFITSAKHESKVITSFLDKTISDSLHVHFIPEKDGNHGSKALWSETINHDEYWSAIKLFLNRLKK